MEYRDSFVLPGSRAVVQIGTIGVLCRYMEPSAIAMNSVIAEKEKVFLIVVRIFMNIVAINREYRPRRQQQQLSAKDWF